jgi:hypothetical protein
VRITVIVPVELDAAAGLRGGPGALPGSGTLVLASSAGGDRGEVESHEPDGEMGNNSSLARASPVTELTRGDRLVACCSWRLGTRPGG